jgi:peptidoglycan/xylan/chitin deacetylase (PgdA/CDA1 family)
MDETLYLLRFDDICPTMNWGTWEPVEARLVALGLHPILAVVPDNRDPRLVAGPPRADFWERVRGWQARGWTIALHGYQHLYVTSDPGLVGLRARSEFAGLPRRDQEDKLRKGLAIFREQGVRAEAWVAPGHSFDRVTVGLLADLGVPVISDGFSRLPFSEDGRVTWVPQQVFDFCPRPAGVWTVCSHPNPWTAADLERFLGSLKAYAPMLTDLPSILARFGGRRSTLGDRLTGWFQRTWSHGLRPGLGHALRGLRSGEERP